MGAALIGMQFGRVRISGDLQTALDDQMEGGQVVGDFCPDISFTLVNDLPGSDGLDKGEFGHPQDHQAGSG